MAFGSNGLFGAKRPE